MKTVLVFVAVLVCISCIVGSDPEDLQSCNNSAVVLLPDLVNIGDLFNNSENYDGEFVAIEGIYLGWGEPIHAPLLTRSDWGVKDETGAIYVTGGYALDPMSDVGVNLIVMGNVRLIDDEINYEDIGPILECKAIILIDTENNTESCPV